VNSYPQRRWYQFSLRRLLFWDVPSVGLLAMIVTWPSDPEPAAPDWLGMNIAMHKIGEVILFRLKILLSLSLILVWLFMPRIVQTARGVRRRTHSQD
jgi:hypothetical protein